MNKHCIRCNSTKSVEEFNWKVRDKTRQVYCRNCAREYIRAHYNANRRYYLDKANKNNQIYIAKIRQIIGDYLSSHPCVDCGEKDILVLEFDHRQRQDKLDSIAVLVKRKISIEKIAAEIKKCEVRCANCHRRKTEKESNSWKLHHAPVA